MPDLKAIILQEMDRWVDIATKQKAENGKVAEASWDALFEVIKKAGLQKELVDHVRRKYEEDEQ